jgi:hypothetical protein
MGINLAYFYAHFKVEWGKTGIFGSFVMPIIIATFQKIRLIASI